MRGKISKSIKIKGTITAILLVSLSCAFSLIIASAVFLFVVTQGIFSGHSLEALLLFTPITLVLCVGFCSILLPRALNKITNPLIEISECSKKVARGDFSVRTSHSGVDELGILADNFNRMVDELSRMEYLRKDFMSSVSHEFKTPLAVIQGLSELLCDEKISAEERKEYSRMLAEETQRLTKLCSNMLRMSQLDNAAYVLDNSSFRLDEQIRRVIVMLEERWREKEIEFVLELPKLEYFGDEELLHQVWLNLIENAIKFSDNQGGITISCVAGEEDVRVSINNRGSGIPAEQKDRIFERFYQCDSSHSSQGNGLGLSIVKKILAIAGANLSCESDQSSGTTFIVALPAYQEAASSDKN